MARAKLTKLQLPALALIPVSHDSTIAWHEFVYTCAKAFKREFGYDTVQWVQPFGRSCRESKGFAEVFTDEEGNAVGAVGFRWRQYKDAPSRWAMQWAWFDPTARRKGLLGRHWSVLRKRYGDFDVETPISPAMMAFLVKQGDAHLAHYNTNTGEAVGEFELLQFTHTTRGGAFGDSVYTGPLMRKPILDTPSFPLK